jgi:hypothetical protein
MSPQERFDMPIDELLAVEGVAPPGGGGGFRASALRFRGKILAMLVRCSLVVKLPR